MGQKGRPVTTSGDFEGKTCLNKLLPHPLSPSPRAERGKRVPFTCWLKDQVMEKVAIASRPHHTHQVPTNIQVVALANVQHHERP